ncbi:MAG: hypothetical protein EZS28_031054 [Streblomastix strix]|uniref:Uncharacterized protein n=1 Tax=Streblomastix strix TaxID=222440 RepID=A0A5J4UTE4_9EUKA|nr:MAG: hypothetical protein EZS28_031054 [Streblomastix strix]
MAEMSLRVDSKLARRLRIQIAWQNQCSVTEVDALLLLKADKTCLENYVELTSTQTITGQKQFGIINVLRISKKNKNDASILLADGVDMQISSLVSQSQIQEIRDIASSKSKGYVFAITDKMNTLMEDQENVAKLLIGDNQYIVDKQVIDYWWDGTGLRALETELQDMSNVMTILGAATGGGNAITDLSFDGNTQIPAKITINTIINSVGIMVQNYDNNSVVCAGGDVKLIQDINARFDFSNYYNNKSQTYFYTETDQKLNLKLNISDYVDAYIKTLDDALLLLKADKTQLIDTYTKGETNNPLNTKADSGVSYIKQENEALPLLKADKSQLIDAYIKQEDDNLLNNKADSGVSDTKGEDSAQLLFKANHSTTYIKTETDYLIPQIEIDDADLSGYMTLSIAQTINANKTFNNAFRFICSIDGMSSITESSFIKSDADDSIILFGASGTKPISEFSSSVDDSNCVKKRWRYEDYITLGVVKSEFVSCIYSDSINGNLTATQFIKSGKDDTQVLLACGGDRLL